MKRIALFLAVMLCLSFLTGTALAELKLPGRLKAIEAQAFYGDASITEATIPEGCTVIKSLAFAQCTELRKVTIPSSVTAIDDSAFLGCDNLVIYCEANSEAERYARRMGIACVPSGEIASGQCGKSITWRLTASGAMVLEGTGATYTGRFSGGSDVNQLWGDYYGYNVELSERVKYYKSVTKRI